jgi:hypothetical protein
VRDCFDVSMKIHIAEWVVSAEQLGVGRHSFVTISDCRSDKLFFFDFTHQDIVVEEFVIGRRCRELSFSYAHAFVQDSDGFVFFKKLTLLCSQSLIKLVYPLFSNLAFVNICFQPLKSIDLLLGF